MDVRIKIGSWQELQKDATRIRFSVFVDEQGVDPNNEIDHLDEVSLHLVAYQEQGSDAPDSSNYLPIATARLVPDGHIGRMAVQKTARGHGIGDLLMRTLLAQAKEQGMLQVFLSAQTHAIKFYQRLGFTVVSKVYLEENIPHQIMRVNL